jgi:acetylornithine deacetylase
MSTPTEFPGVSELLSAMIGFDTVNAGISGKERPEQPLVEFLEELAQESGLEARRLPVPGQSDELLLLYQHDPALPWILFDSHLDTVSVDGMSIEPFAGREGEGKIWGRGACDTKGTGAAMFRGLHEYSHKPGNNNIALLFSVDEEWGMSGIREFTNLHYRDLGFAVKGAVIGEPTRLQTVVAHNGVLRYAVQTHGVAAHSSTPALGVSAISTMAHLITFLEEEFIPTCTAEDPITGRAQCSINVVRGGTAANIIPDLCEIQVDRRTVPGESSADGTDRFREAVLEFERRHPKTEITWQVSVDTPVLDHRLSTEFSAGVLKVMSGAGLGGSGIGVTYATHAGDLSVAGIPSVVLGPGDIAQGHTKDEWIDVQELKKGVEIYRTLMAKL